MYCFLSYKNYTYFILTAKDKSDGMRRPPTGGGPKPASPTPVELALIHHMEDQNRPTLHGISTGHDTEEGSTINNM